MAYAYCCPACKGDNVECLGSLGRTTHYRCRSCGWTFTTYTEN